MRYHRKVDDSATRSRTRLTKPLASSTDDEILRWALAYLRHAPLSLSLREINRLVAFQSFQARQPKQGPVLDVGCGDGFWWTVREDDREIYGIDISASEIAQARERIHAELTDVSQEQPFRGTKFEEIIGNCSLEHVPDIDAALSNLRRAASPTRAPPHVRADAALGVSRQHAEAVVEARAARRDGDLGCAQRLLPALASLRREGLAAPARAERLARRDHGRARLRALRVLVPRVLAAGVRRVRRQEGHRILSVAARADRARCSARVRSRARALGGQRSDRAGRFAARVRVSDRRPRD